MRRHTCLLQSNCHSHVTHKNDHILAVDHGTVPHSQLNAALEIQVYQLCTYADMYTPQHHHPPIIILFKVQDPASVGVLNCIDICKAAARAPFPCIHITFMNMRHHMHHCAAAVAIPHPGLSQLPSSDSSRYSRRSKNSCTVWEVLCLLYPEGLPSISMAKPFRSMIKNQVWWAQYAHRS